MVSLGPPSRYRARVLRCWEAPGDTAERPPRWRCSLEDPHTRERRGFADLAALLAFVRAVLEPGDGPLDDAGKPRKIAPCPQGPHGTVARRWVREYRPWG